MTLFVGASATGKGRLRIQALVDDAEHVDPRILTIAYREARIPLEAALPPAVVFSGVGLIGVLRRPKKGSSDGEVGVEPKARGNEGAPL